MKHHINAVPIGIFAVTLAATSVSAQVILSDAFSRVAGVPGPNLEWGSNDNGLGGTVVQAYNLLPNSPGANGGGWTDGELGYIRNNAPTVNYNLAADPNIIAAGGFIAEIELKPFQDANGRQWSGVNLNNANMQGNRFVDTSSTMLAGIGVRNIGTVIARLDNDTFFGHNYPNADAGIGIEQALTGSPYQDYLDNFFNQPYANALTYRVKVEVASTFAPNASATARFFAAIGNNPYEQIDMDLDGGNGLTVSTFLLGATPELYLGLQSIRGGGPSEAWFDNLIITAIPEPGSISLLLLGAAGLLALRRARRE